MNKKILGSIVALSAVSVSFAQNSSLTTISNVSSISSESSISTASSSYSQTSMNSITYTGETISYTLTGEDAANVGKVAGGFAIFSLGMMLFALLSFIFWIWMFVDAIKHDSKDRTMWILIMLFTNILGTIAYYFVVYKARKTAEKNGSFGSSTTTTTTVSTPTTPSV